MCMPLLCNNQLSRVLPVFFLAGLEWVRAHETIVLQAGYSQKAYEVWAGLRFQAQTQRSNYLGNSY